MTTTELLAYTSVPTLDVPATVALTTELLLRVPRKPEEPVRKAAKGMRVALEVLREAWESRAPAPIPEVTRKAADRRVDAAWGATYRRISAWLELPDGVSEKPRAAALVARLFPEGLSFLTLSHKTQWAEGDKRLKQIESESLTSAVEELAGSQFLAELYASQRLFGEVLGLLKMPEDAPPPSIVAEPLQNLRQAIRAYVVRMIALVEEDEPASVDLAVRALAPIAEARVSRGSSQTATEPAADSNEPLAQDPAQPVAPPTP